jgi:hypothetical protein
MGNLTTALTFVLILNVLTQAAVIEVNPEANVFFTNEGTMLSNFDAGNNTLNVDNIANDLPTGQGSVSPTTGNLFTDVFSSAKTWLAKKTGLSYLTGILSAPYNMLSAMNLPRAFTFAVGTMWYALTLFLIIAFIWGRDS